MPDIAPELGHADPGAPVDGAAYPSGDAAVDELLRRAGWDRA